MYQQLEISVNYNITTLAKECSRQYNQGWEFVGIIDSTNPTGLIKTTIYLCLFKRKS